MAVNDAPRVLISGAGIAGTALAYWLARHGMRPTLVEKAPGPRTGGYIIDFWGSGYEVAERMGVLPEILARGYQVREVRMVARDGRRAGGFATDVFERFTQGRFTSLPRGDLASVLLGALPDTVETIFGDQIASLQDDGDRVTVQFERAGARVFDLVIGADGLHSRVRELVFGPHSDFEVYLGYRVAAVEIAGYRPRDELVYVLYSQVGQQVARFAMRDDRTLALFVFAEPDARRSEAHGTAAQLAVLRERFGASGWECNAILDAIDPAGELYFDRVSQIRMPHWSRGRVALVGDAGACVSLLAGQGTALAMVEAYVLAGELATARGDHATAFVRYEERLQAFLAAKQKAAERFAASFAPKSRLRLFARNQASKLLGIRWIAKLAFGRSLVDRLELPRYDSPE